MDGLAATSLSALSLGQITAIDEPSPNRHASGKDVHYRSSRSSAIRVRVTEIQLQSVAG